MSSEPLLSKLGGLDPPPAKAASPMTRASHTAGPLRLDARQAAWGLWLAPPNKLRLLPSASAQAQGFIGLWSAILCKPPLRRSSQLSLHRVAATALPAALPRQLFPRPPPTAQPADGTVAVSMNFVNKASMQMLPLPNVVMVLQVWGRAGRLACWRSHNCTSVAWHLPSIACPVRHVQQLDAWPHRFGPRVRPRR
jgi:hypothetical protein